MAKNKHQEPEELPPAPNQPPKESDLERRLLVVEKAIDDMRKSHLEHHKWFVTIIFSLVGILLVYTANHSSSELNEAVRDMKSDLRNATGDMQVKVDGEVSEMQKQFAALAGDALKKPILDILCGGLPLENQTIVTYITPYQYPAQGTLESIFVRNTGDKKTDPIKIEIAYAGVYQIIPEPGSGWEQVRSAETNFPTAVRCTQQDTVSPNETMNIQPLSYELYSQIGTPLNAVTNSCTIRIFYGGERPAEAHFNIAMVPKR